MNTKILKKYEIRVEENSMGSDTPVIMYSVYDIKDGGYVGPVDEVQKYFDRGILPELSAPDNNVCSIGKSITDGKWYGWSHRAIFGFKIGDTVKKGDCTASSGYTEEYLKEHGDPLVLKVGFKAKTEQDTKKMAIAFASSVS